ncbi:ester cyclase [Microbacterium sp.]|uniref:ester cyclase n=1 Tax=Microbacterium sp. TaxID=51671 RepID=UPI002E30E53E|nr:ester cyclase [Microbacterium sp.]HEX5728035.1 ester cyclase [Microbacterium sp.]
MHTEQLLSPSVRVVERMLTEGFATGNTDIVDELCSPDLVEHQFGLSGRGREAIDKVKRGITDVFRAMPDIRFTIEDWSEHGDTVWIRAEATATQTGPFMGPPTGRPVRFTVIDVARVVDGRIVEHWGVPDRFAILVQTGQLQKLVADT